MMSKKQVFYDDEKTIELLDKLVSIQYPCEYGTIHRVTPDSEVFRIVPKYSALGPGKDDYRYAASVKEVFEILRANSNYKLNWYTGPCESVRDIKIKWMVLDALGLPYIKLGGELESVYWGAKEPLVYSGNSKEQAWEYYEANVTLGFEEPNDVYKKKCGPGDAYLAWISDCRKLAEKHQKIR